MKMLCAATAGFLLIGFAGAAEESTTKAVPVGSQAEQEGAPVGSPVRTSGKIVAMHSCPLVGVADPHIVVKIQTDEGDTEIVDLGSTGELTKNGIEAKEGKQLWVDGRVGKINDKFLIVAERLSETKLVSITRTAPLREETVKHAEARNEGTTPKDATVASKDPAAPKTETVDAGQQVRTVEGSIVHSRHVKIEGESEEHVLAKLQTEHGVAVVDLGCVGTMPNNLNLTEGQTLAATGFVGKLNGKPIIVADSVGHLFPIRRAADHEAIPASVPANATK